MGGKEVTPREIGVLKQITVGESYKTAGKALGIRFGTARTHIQNAFSRLEASGTLQAVRKAADKRLIDLTSLFSSEQIEKLKDLSPRQFQVLVHSISKEGKLKTAQEIAEELDMSPETVRVHRENIRKKLQVTSITVGCLILTTAAITGFKYYKKRGKFEVSFGMDTKETE